MMWGREGYRGEGGEVDGVRMKGLKMGEYGEEWFGVERVTEVRARKLMGWRGEGWWCSGGEVNGVGMRGLLPWRWGSCWGWGEDGCGGVVVGMAVYGGRWWLCRKY